MPPQLAASYLYFTPLRRVVFVAIRQCETAANTEAGAHQQRLREFEREMYIAHAAH